jgi:hypothetical protein
VYRHLHVSEMLRICLRNGFSRDPAGMLVDDLQHATERLERRGNRVRGRPNAPRFITRRSAS